ncbi:MAG: GatB/YqeY domain-containing protein [Rhizobiales bacterium]|nr:GatB/YqeY domain-containing protein [Hyphomicrobiales bacterium]
MREAINADLKTATLARDKPRTAALRLISAAIKDRDIVARGTGQPQASDTDLVDLLAKMVKQRLESARIYEENGRPELAAQERGEIAVIEHYLPKQLSEDEAKAAIAAVIAATGAAGFKDMGKVMAELKARHAGQMDFSKASAAVKAALAG